MFHEHVPVLSCLIVRPDPMPDQSTNGTIPRRFERYKIQMRPTCMPAGASLPAAAGKGLVGLTPAAAAGRSDKSAETSPLKDSGPAAGARSGAGAGAPAGAASRYAMVPCFEGISLHPNHWQASHQKSLALHASMLVPTACLTGLSALH